MSHENKNHTRKRKNLKTLKGKHTTSMLVLEDRLILLIIIPYFYIMFVVLKSLLC